MFSFFWVFERIAVVLLKDIDIDRKVFIIFKLLQKNIHELSLLVDDLFLLYIQLMQVLLFF